MERASGESARQSAKRDSFFIGKALLSWTDSCALNNDLTLLDRFHSCGGRQTPAAHWIARDRFPGLSGTGLRDCSGRGNGTKVSVRADGGAATLTRLACGRRVCSGAILGDLWQRQP